MTTQIALIVAVLAPSCFVLILPVLVVVGIRGGRPRVLLTLLAVVAARVAITVVAGCGASLASLG